jgi:DNA-binding NtrC family response regulator
MNKARILIVDDEAIARENLCHALGKDGHVTDEASSGEQALKLLGNNDYDLVISDLKMPGISGIDLLQKVRAQSPTTEMILITGYSSVSTAVEAMRKGAYTYIEKPINLEELRVHVQRALEKRALSAEVIVLRQSLKATRDPLPIIGQSPAMAALKTKIRQVALMGCNVLIQGETGTGKELVAQGIHKLSPRCDERFMAINCGTFTEELMDKELFGHEREAFTGAGKGQPGLLEVANKGVVFFDEVGELPLHLQVKLLRVLQERTFIRVGGTKEISLDIQVVAATNCDLAALVDKGAFRRDLFYRLNVVTLTVPPLRERKADLPLLLNYFLEKHATKQHRFTNIAQETLEALENYSFPGNVRELENIVERALALGSGETMTPDLLPEEVRIPSASLQNPQTSHLMTLEEMERHYIADILAAVGGNKTRAAAILGIDRVSLWRKLKRLHVEKECV